MEILRDRTYLVGGAVRDLLLGREPKDLDFVVVNSSEEEMLTLGFKRVGESFPVFLHQETGHEYALARREKKKDGENSHTAFSVETSGVTLEEDLSRRDLTINAMAVKLSDYEAYKDSLALYVIDPFGGRKDLQQKKLRHVSSAFAEDPLRVLRVAKFATRYGFDVDQHTLLEMEAVVFSKELLGLSSDRLWKELGQALSYAKPSIFFKILDKVGAIEQLMPELHDSLNNWCVADNLGIGPELKLALILKDANLDDIKSLCTRLKVPILYQETANIVAKHYKMWPKTITSKVADLVLDTLKAIDAFRKPERVKMLRYAAELIGGRDSHLWNCGRALEECYDACLAVSFDDVIRDFKGKEIGFAIDELRKIEILLYLGNERNGKIITG